MIRLRQRARFLSWAESGSPLRSLMRCVYSFVFLLLSTELWAGGIYGINHTHWAINHFSVEGRPAIDIIGPYQGGGGGWGYSAPKHWTPGMTVRVDWETGEGSTKGFPGFGDSPEFFAWEKMINDSKRQLTKQVPVPDYTGQKTCGLTVHFLPCDDLQVTTSCYAYGQPEYPIKTPLRLPEPTSCPQ